MSTPVHVPINDAFTLTADAMNLDRNGCTYGTPTNAARVVDRSVTNESLVRALFYYTWQQVKAQRRGHMRQAVWYKRAARDIGTIIRQRVEDGRWDG